MSRTLRTVIVNGSLHRPSRTKVLLDALRDRLNDSVALEVEPIELVDLLPELGATLSKDLLSTKARAALESIEQAELLIVGSPVFRASLPGLLKHLFDLVDLHAFNGKPILLASTGGSQRHALVIDHQLRPLFGFFQALTLPVGVYAIPDDFRDGQLASEDLQRRIDLTVELAAPVLHGLFQLEAAHANFENRGTLEVQAV